MSTHDSNPASSSPTSQVLSMLSPGLQEAGDLGLATASGAGCGEPALSLDTNVYSRTFRGAPRKPWGQHQKRIFHRCMSVLSLWAGRGLQIAWLGLTGAPGSDRQKLAAHHKELRRRVRRTFGYDLEYVSVETSEGHGVLHIFWAWAGEGRFYVPQSWLSDQWQAIHGSPICWIKRAELGDRARMSRYSACQYVAKHGSALVRITWSWKSVDFPLVKEWKAFREHCAKDGKLRKKAGFYWNKYLEGYEVRLWDGTIMKLRRGDNAQDDQGSVRG